MAGKKSCFLAAGLSLLLAGAGHLYLGNYRKATLFFVFGELLAGLIYLYLNPDIAVLLSLFASVYAAYDSYIISKALNTTYKEDKKRKTGPDIRI